MAFAYFVILAGMRTGSNLLEESLSSVSDITLHGELFNPHFFGRPKVETKFGMSIAERDAEPLRVVHTLMSQQEGFHGFRLFRDHNKRVLSHLLEDKNCAKIILTRRSIDSFVSLEIARATGQWWLGDANSARSAKVRFDPDAFAEFDAQNASFYHFIDRSLQKSGQSAFRLSYDDLSVPDIIDGLAKFIGSKGGPNVESIQARVQNPTPVAARLTNPQVARDYLNSNADDIGHTPSYEPHRGPGVRFFQAPQDAPVLYLPIRGAGSDPVPNWLKSLGEGEVLTGMTQRDLRRWKRKHPGHLSFTVLRHPLARAYDAFCQCILPTDQERFGDVRHALVHRFNVPLPSEWPLQTWTIEEHRDAFFRFLEFLKSNLNGQTSVRVDSVWASQDRLLGAIASLVVPDRVIREESLGEELENLSHLVGLQTTKLPEVAKANPLFELSAVVTPEIERAAEAAYRRDYMMFGFGPWARHAA